MKSCKTIIMECAISIDFRTALRLIGPILTHRFGDEIASGYAAAEKQFDYKIAKELKAVLGVCGKNFVGFCMKFTLFSMKPSIFGLCGLILVYLGLNLVFSHR